MKLLQFGEKISKVCIEEGVTPIAWGGLAFFAYTQDESLRIHDIDFLIPERKLVPVMERLRKRKISFRYIPSPWNSIIITHKGLTVELDPYEQYHPWKQKFQWCRFGNTRIKVVSIGALKKMYLRASKVSNNKPEQHLQRYHQLLKV